MLNLNKIVQDDYFCLVSRFWVRGVGVFTKPSKLRVDQSVLVLISGSFQVLFTFIGIHIFTFWHLFDLPVIRHFGGSIAFLIR